MRLPNLVWRHEPWEVFGCAPVRRLLGIGWGPDWYFGLVVTGTSSEVQPDIPSEASTGNPATGEPPNPTPTQ